MTDREHLKYLFGQFNRLLEMHALVVMDTADERALHNRSIACFRKVSDLIRREARL